MTRVAAGDDGAFEELVRRTKGLVAGVIYRTIGHPRETDDLAQEVFLRIWEARGRWRPEARVVTWIGTITARLCLNEREKLARRRGESPAGEAAAPESSRPGADESEAVRAALSSLSDTQRMAIALRYFGELSDRETAEALGLSLSAAQALLFRARRKLIEVLPQEVDSSQ